ncbi:MAG: PQQ-binding-like beta-propeller repeat protein [Planctomycetes bacterium]|nr:PQQ-binding-like beta-propeller repeat protein [Planctomycetota bacterium]
MPSLELRYGNGTVEQRVLSRTQPLTIGRQPFNDICVPEDDVAAMHCRILWNKSEFEVTAATGDGVEVNGISVAHARLHPGDVVRVGSLDLHYQEETAAEDDTGFKLLEPEEEHSTRRPATPRRDSKREPQPPEPDLNPLEDMSLYMGAVYTESQALEAFEAGEQEDAASNVPLKPLVSSHLTGMQRKERPPAATRPRLAAVSGLTMRARPGEQDVLRSPLVLGLSLGGLVLILITGIFWFLIGREQATRLYDRALTELNDGQYSQSIASFEQFEREYPGHSLRKQARRGLGRALVQKEISGATPAWKTGLEQLQALISHHRNEADFAEMHSTIHHYAGEIALGAARSAESSRDAGLLTVSEDAQVVLERFADPASPPTVVLEKIKEARIAAAIAIGKQKLFDDAMAAIDAALAAKQPMVALSEREKLVRAYDGFASHKRVKEALQKAVELERQVIVNDDRERPAESTETFLLDPRPALSLFHSRTRSEDASLGRVAYVMAKDACYAVDSVTGEVVWRRTTGFNAPFFPVTVTGSQPGLLLYDSYQRSLLCCGPVSGKLIWRQTLQGRPRSAPLVHEGQIYLPTDDQSLCRIDLDTGRLTERISFSQNVSGPPVLSEDGKHLILPGEMAMIYALSMRPLAPAAMTFTDHAAGSISAPPLGLGRLLLLCVNDKADSSQLRLWDAGNPQVALTEMTGKSVRVRGQVRESPVLRGNQLVVPSSGERLAVFSVTDEPGREELAPVAQYQVHEDEEIEKRRSAKAETANSEPKFEPEPEAKPAAKHVVRAPLYVAMGADRQLWMASSAFRRFEIGADAIRMDSNSLALGIASQRLQQIDDQFFVGRKLPFHDAVIFSSVERERMISPWRTVVGAELLAVGPGRDGGAIGISEAGHVVVMSQERLQQGGFDLKGTVELELPARVQQRLTASTLHDGRFFLAANGDVAQVWIIGTGGQIDLTAKLGQEPVQTGAVLVDDGLIVPLPGRLKLIPTAGRKAVQDWIAPVGDRPAATWKHLLRLDAAEVLACTDSGLLTRIQVRNTDVPHLAEAAKIQLEMAVDIPPIVRNEALLVADASRTVQHFNWRTFDLEGKRQFAATVRGLWAADSGCLVWTGDGTLHLLSDGRDLPLRWSLALKGLEPAGAPLLTDGKFWIACRDGTVLAIDAAAGTESRRLRVPQALTTGLKKLGDDTYAVACDGALYRLNLAGDQ